MNYPVTEIDKITVELNALTKAYALRAEALASDPYFREAILKVAVNSFSWQLYHAFKDDFDRRVLNEELKVQSAAIDRAVNNGGSAN